MATLSFTNRHPVTLTILSHIGLFSHSFSKLDQLSSDDNKMSTAANENDGLEVLVNKVLENAVIGMNNKIDARLNSIEEQLSSAQKSTDSFAKRTSNVESLNEHKSTGVNQVSNFFIQMDSML
ncbi:hypothetical protein CEXT_573241 [Caerostris extrusa]|uniref:Uncharacterized protein n=1 Tax=Caerostris extrusa TaxID=172846 RepID=A0AAV4VNE0_CAEEX|nr:hypothetical protein CEXT_573241 [Caerostris extrusa]